MQGFGNGVHGKSYRCQTLGCCNNNGNTPFVRFNALLGPIENIICHFCRNPIWIPPSERVGSQGNGHHDTPRQPPRGFMAAPPQFWDSNFPPLKGGPQPRKAGADGYPGKGGKFGGGYNPRGGKGKQGKGKGVPNHSWAGKAGASAGKGVREVTFAERGQDEDRRRSSTVPQSANGFNLAAVAQFILNWSTADRLSPEELQAKVSELLSTPSDSIAPKPKSSSVDAEVTSASRKLKALQHEAQELQAAIQKRMAEVERQAMRLATIEQVELPGAQKELEGAQERQRNRVSSASAEDTRVPAGSLILKTTPPQSAANLAASNSNGPPALGPQRPQEGDPATVSPPQSLASLNAEIHSSPMADVGGARSRVEFLDGAEAADKPAKVPRAVSNDQAGGERPDHQGGASFSSDGTQKKDAGLSDGFIAIMQHANEVVKAQQAELAKAQSLTSNDDISSFGDDNL